MPGSPQQHSKGAPVNMSGTGEEPVNKLWQAFGKMAQEVNLVMRSLEHMKDAVVDATAQMRRLAVLSLVMAGPRQHIPFGVRDWLSFQGQRRFPGGAGRTYRGPGGPGGGGGGSPVLPPRPGGGGPTAGQVIGGSQVNLEVLKKQAANQAGVAKARAAGAAHAEYSERAAASHRATLGTGTVGGGGGGEADRVAALGTAIIEQYQDRLTENQSLLKGKGLSKSERKRLRKQVMEDQQFLANLKKEAGDAINEKGTDFALTGDAGSGSRGGRGGNLRRKLALLRGTQFHEDYPLLPGRLGAHAVDKMGRSHVYTAPGAGRGIRRHELFHSMMAQARDRGTSTGAGWGPDLINMMRSQVGLKSLGRVLEEASAYGVGTGNSWGNFFTGGMAGKYARHYVGQGQYGSAAFAGTGHALGKAGVFTVGLFRPFVKEGKAAASSFWKDFTRIGIKAELDRRKGRVSGLERFGQTAGMPFLAGTAAMTGILKAASPDTFDTLFKSVELMLTKMGPAVIPPSMWLARRAQDAGDLIGGMSPGTQKMLGYGAAGALGITAIGLVAAKLVGALKTLAVAAAHAGRALGAARRQVGGLAGSRQGRVMGTLAGAGAGALAGSMVAGRLSQAFGFSEGSTGDMLTTFGADALGMAAGGVLARRGWKGAARGAARVGGPAAFLYAQADSAAEIRKQNRGERVTNEAGVRDAGNLTGVTLLNELAFANRLPGESLRMKVNRIMNQSANRLGGSDGKFMAKNLVDGWNGQGMNWGLMKLADGSVGTSGAIEDRTAHEEFMKKAMHDYIWSKGWGRYKQGEDGKMVPVPAGEEGGTPIGRPSVFENFEFTRQKFLKMGGEQGGYDKYGKDFEEFLEKRLKGQDVRSKAEAAEEKYYSMARSSQTTAQFMTVDDAWRSAMLAGLRDPLEQKLDTEREKNLALALQEMMNAQTQLLEEIKNNTGGANQKLTP